MITRPLAGPQPWLVGNGPPTEGPIAAKGNETDHSRHLPLRRETPLPARIPATTCLAAPVPCTGLPEFPLRELLQLVGALWVTASRALGCSGKLWEAP